jgi:hypothetical protein
MSKCSSRGVARTAGSVAGLLPEACQGLASRVPQWLQLFLMLVSTACATVQPDIARRSVMSTDSAAGRPARSDRRLITRVEIQEGMLTAYDVVARSRPSWLVPRGAVNGRPEVPDVYIGAVRYGSLETLKNINATDVAELRLLDAADATIRADRGAPSGVILVTLRRR